MFSGFEIIVLIGLACLVSKRAAGIVEGYIGTILDGIVRSFKGIFWLIKQPFRHWPYVLGGVVVIAVGYLILQRGLYLYGEYGIAGVILTYIFAMFLYSYPKLLGDLIKDWRERKQQPRNNDSLNQ